MTPSEPSKTPISDPTGRRPGGRVRLAAALSGAGVLAVGLGGGVVQSAADDPVTGTASAPGAEALGHQEAKALEPSESTSSTPVAPAPSGATTATPLPAATPPATDPAAAPVAEAPVAEAAADPARAPEAAAATPAPSPEPAAPAPEAPAAPQADPAADPAAEQQPKPRKRKPKPAEECTPSRDLAVSAAAELEAEIAAVDEDAVECAPEPKPRKRVRKPRKRAGDRGDEPVRSRPTPAPQRTSGGAPTNSNPTVSLAVPGPAPIGVPNFFIDKFRIPPFLLPIYQAAGTEYGVRWELLAAINEIETDYGRNLNVSSAGALGWMQFMPATWKAYGVDANGDKKKDPYNPVDAIFAAARYLEASGARDDLRGAIFAYNRADWYVDSVLMRARLIGGLPSDLVGSLTGLTQGRFPVDGKARYADDLDEARATRRIARGTNASIPVDGDAERRGVKIFAEDGTPAVATHDGVVVKRGLHERLGRFVQVRDAYGNIYTYGRLGKLEASQPVPRRGEKPAPEPTPQTSSAAVEPRAGAATVTPSGRVGKERLFAAPGRPRAFAAGGRRQVEAPAPEGRERYVRDLLGLAPKQVTWKALEPGSRVVAGTVLGRVGRSPSATSTAPHVLFEIRPAGSGAPRVDPKPILDGWKLLESTAIYRAEGKNPFFGDDAKTATIGQILLMSKDTLQRRVLANSAVELSESGRQDISTGRIDRRVLALLEFLAGNGLKPTVSSLYRPGAITVSGNVSQHSTGSAVDIAAINGIPMMGNQGKGSITDIAIRRMLTLQGPMRADQIISLMSYDGASNTLAMGDHADHIHVGYRPVAGAGPRGGLNAVLKPGQWHRVMGRLNAIKNPTVRTTPSKASIKVTPKRRGRD